MTEFKNCAKDFRYFLTNYWRVISHCNRVETIKPHKYQWQLTTLVKLVPELLINSARKTGITTMYVAYGAWSMLFKMGYTIVVTGPSQIIAKEFIDKLYYSYNKLPEELKIGVTSKTPFTLELTNGSKVIVVSPTPTINNSADLIIIDNAAFIPNLNNLQDTLRPTLNSKGCMITSSTLYQDSEFLAQCVTAREKESNIEYLEIPSSANYFKTGKWVTNKVNKLGRTKAKVEMQPCYFIKDKELTHINNWEG